MRRTKEKDLVIQQIDKCLPQTHCQKCGFVSCLPYAKAIVKKKTNIYKCEPGGFKVVEKLGEITGEKIVRANIKEAPPELVVDSFSTWAKKRQYQETRKESK